MLPEPPRPPTAPTPPSALPWMLLLVVAMLSVQLGSAWAKQIFVALGPTQTAAWRMLLSCALLWLLPGWRRQPLPAAALRPLLALGAALVLMNAAFYQALARLPLGLAVALEFTGPLAVAAWSSRRRREVALAGLALVGVMGITPWRLEGAERLAAGCLWALLGGVGWALYILFGQRCSRHLPGGQALAYAMTIAASIGLVTTSFACGRAWPWQLLPPRQLWPALLGMAAVSSAIPYSLEMVVLRHMDRFAFSLLLSLEPAVAALCGTLLLGEVLQPQQALSIVCIVVAAAGGALRPPPAASPPP